MESSITFTVNGKQATVRTDPDRPLLDVLREDLHLTGTHFGCGQAKCGACSVLVDGKRKFSCTTPVSEVADTSITTIEGLSTGEQLHPVQEAFLAENAFQCGYCTSGMIITAVSLLTEKPKPSAAEIITGMNRNICRCCTYPRIVKAIQRASGQEGR